MINEARITLSIDDVYIPVNTALNGFNRGVFGINYPYLIPNGKDEPNKIPTVTIPNFSSLAGGPYPSHSSGTIWTAGDTLDQGHREPHSEIRVLTWSIPVRTMATRSM